MIPPSNSSALQMMSLLRKSTRTRSRSNHVTRLYSTPTICLVSLHPMMVFGDDLLSSHSMPKLQEATTSRTIASIFMTMLAAAFWRGSSKVPKKSSSLITRFPCRSVCRMPLMNIVARTIGLVTFFLTNVKLTRPIKKALLLFIRPTATILWTATSMCAVPLTSTLH